MSVLTTKPQRAPSSKKRSGALDRELPNQREIQAYLDSRIAGERDEKLWAAQDFIYDAWERTSARSRIALAYKALRLSPLCADGYNVLAAETTSPKQACDLYSKGIQAGRMALGPEGFKQHAGNFWRVLETRPYMRSMAGLAETYKSLGEPGMATALYQEMLTLNPNDNQGARYLLAALLLGCGDDKALKTLLTAYRTDGSPHWLYTKALVAFRASGANDRRAIALARTALMGNRHVPRILSNASQLEFRADGYVTVGQSSEASYYVVEFGGSWHGTPGAVDWLNKVAAQVATLVRGAATLH